MLGAQFQAAAVGVDGRPALALVSEALTEKIERVGLLPVSDGGGQSEKRDGFLEPVFPEGLQAFGVFVECLETFESVSYTHLTLPTKA